MVFVLLQRYLKRLVAFAAALVFLVHPMNIEAVSYISATQTTLSLFFGLIALLLINKLDRRQILKYDLFWSCYHRARLYSTPHGAKLA